MKNHRRNTTHSGKKNAFRNRSLFFFGVASLLWFLFRTGTKPSRIRYPCQRAALANSSLIFSLSIPFSLAAVLTKTKKIFSKKEITVVLLIIVASIVMCSEQFWGNLQLAGAVDSGQEIQLSLQSRNATAFPASNIYVVNGRAYAHIEDLVNFMGLHGLLFYKSGMIGENQGPEGLIARDDVVLIKTNCQWDERGEPTQIF